MPDAVGGVRPYHGRADRGHHVDEDAQRRRQVDSAPEQQAEIPAEQCGPVIGHHLAGRRQAR
jgi:hypothetical protein